MAARAAGRGIASFPPVIPQNPYQRLLYEELVQHGYSLVPSFRLKVGELWRSRRKVRVLHFHWPQGYYVSPRGTGRVRVALSGVRIGLFTLRLLLARVLGYRVVWTVHEVYPHEKAGRRIDQVGGFVLAKCSSLLLAHDLATASSAEQAFRLRSGTVQIVPHASYDGYYAPGRDRATVRRALGLRDDAFVFLSFGHIRAYKDLDLLVSAFSDLKIPDVALVIAGLVMDDHSAEVIERVAASDPRVHTELRFIPDDEVAELFGACDAVVISRGDGGTSGALVLALSLGIPAVAADAQTYRELTDGEEAGWLFTPGDADALRGTLERAATDPNHSGKAAAANRRAESLRWPEVGSKIAKLLDATHG
jgi:beta-1,4-mannosyltransferase